MQLRSFTAVHTLRIVFSTTITYFDWFLWSLSTFIIFSDYVVFLMFISQKITTFLVFGNSLPQLYRHCVLHFQPPFFTLIDFCYPSTYIHSLFSLIRWFFSCLFPKNGPNYIICKNRPVVFFVFPWMSYLYLIWREKYQVTVLCNVFTVSSSLKFRFSEKATKI